MSKTAEEYLAERLAREEELDNKTNFLTQQQRDAILIAQKALTEAEWSAREMFDLTMDDARNISNAECKLRIAFPNIGKLAKED
tara:strand:+ start:580 stop:831 length:252 start_codon:yes stop_codon:yes gene_type:complete